MNCQSPSSTIQAIDKTIVHKICSGQVVLTLSIAVKELVENSIDAGSTNIEIKLKNHGSEVIEVSDNGVGVEECNFEAVTQKHSTSKLREFADLTSVETFGFRGEALSSLCALSDLTIITRHKDSPVATRIEYDKEGKIMKKTVSARTVGTTVVINRLFSTLPVRHKEFTKNLRREFTKMIQLLYSYCIISTGVRISCTNQNGNGSKSVVLATHGNSSVKENIASIFGSKQASNLLPFQQYSPDPSILEEYSISPKAAEFELFEIEGWISSCEHGHGRSSTDRQFFFINGRPCSEAKLSKVVNEVYHLYNNSQYPMVILNIKLSKDLVDINVTPDKRLIFIQNDKLLSVILKSSLLQLFKNTASVFNTSNSLSMPTSKSLGEEKNLISLEKNNAISKTVTLSNLKRAFSSTFSASGDSSQNSRQNSPKQRKLDGFVNHERKQCSSNDEEQKPSDSVMKFNGDVSVEVQEGIKVNKDIETSETHSELKQSFDLNKESQNSALFQNCKISLKEKKNVENLEVQSEERSFECLDKERPNSQLVQICQELLSEKRNINNDEASPKAIGVTDSNVMNDSTNLTSLETTKKINHKTVVNINLCEKSDDTETDKIAKEIIQNDEFDSAFKLSKKVVNVEFSLKNLKQIKRESIPNDETHILNKFRAKIKPTDNQSAEKELSKEISKDSFHKMEIIGQFNLGFIIAKLNTDLFIIDQHATDEKYNFEMLQRDTVLQTQKLIQPLNLELPPAEENILLDNLSIFEKNGFNFEIDEKAVATCRVKLTSIPISKNYSFGKEDVDELIFMLSDAPGRMCRPSRVRQMFASRACRKSVMIGTHLNDREMKRLICHMGDIEHPWNCPHGRPTIRHLINFNLLSEIKQNNIK